MDNKSPKIEEKAVITMADSSDLLFVENNQGLIDSIYDYPERFLTFVKLHPEINDTNGDMVYMAQKLIDEGWHDKDLQFRDIEDEADARSMLGQFRDYLNQIFLKNKRSQLVDVYQKRNYNSVKQSMQLTKVRYDFTPCEKNIFLKVVEVCQQFLYEDVIINNCSIRMEDFHAGGIVPVVRFPIKDILGENGTNYTWVKQGLSALNQKRFQLPNDRWDFVETQLFQRVMSDERSGEIGVILTIDFWDAFRDMECYKVIDVKLAMSFKSIYAERIYELLVGNTREIIYDIENLKKMFCLEDKYKNNGDFIKWVVERAKKEIDETAECPFFFEYEPLKGAGRKFEKIKFIVIPKEEEEPKDSQTKIMADFAEKVTLSENLLDVVRACYPQLNLERKDIIIKLKWAQGHLGVNETIEQVKKIKGTAVDLFVKGKIKSSIDAFFLGSLMRHVQMIMDEEKKKHVYHAPEKPKDNNVYPFPRVNIGKDDEFHNIGEDDEYKYFTAKYIRHCAKVMEMSVDEYIKKWDFELISGGYWRLKKD